MKRSVLLALTLTLFSLPQTTLAQFNEDQLGAWYMYFYSASFKEGPWGIQGDAQFRNWNLGGDLEQLLLRSGLTYTPEAANIKFTLGYANITTGAFGEDNSTVGEHRIYQEALFPVRFARRFYTNHRFRYEQRFVDDQDLRTRFRYNLFLNIALSKQEMDPQTIYLALYNELFVNGQREIGNGHTVELFDRNRFYSAVGYVIEKGKKVQLGVMNQTTDNWSKNQLQLSFHHAF